MYNAPEGIATALRRQVFVAATSSGAANCLVAAGAKNIRGGLRPSR
jgi:hypothetical protein